MTERTGDEHEKAAQRGALPITSVNRDAVEAVDGASIEARRDALAVQLHRVDELLQHRKLVFGRRTRSERSGTTILPCCRDDCIHDALKSLLHTFWTLHGRDEMRKARRVSP